jgi:hypothetical protein
VALNVAPTGSAGAIAHVTAPLAQPPSVAAGAIASACVSVTACGVAIAVTFTVPAPCETSIVNPLLAPLSPLAAVAVSVNGP